MAVVQISWRDNSDNETSFKIYRGTTSPLSASSDHIGNVVLNNGVWEAEEGGLNTAPDIALTSTNTGNSDTTSETFVVTYTESTANAFYYGVSASNAIGDSDVVTTSAALTVS